MKRLFFRKRFLFTFVGSVVHCKFTSGMLRKTLPGCRLVEVLRLLCLSSFLSLSGLSEMVTETASSPGPFRNAQMSKASQTHKLRKLRAPSKCRECDGLVVFHGAECEEVSTHKHTHTSLILNDFLKGSFLSI